MLDFSLVSSSILLILVCLSACKSKRPLSNILSISIAFGLFSLGVCMIALPAVFFQAVAVGILGVVWAWLRWRPRTYVLLSCAATLTVYAVVGVIAWQDTTHLQEEFAYISLEGRLPSPAKPHSAEAMPSTTGDRLNQLEDRYEKENSSWSGQRRTDILRALHENTVEVFVDQPGFGVTRMGGMTRWLLTGAHQRQPIPQPGIPSPSPWVSTPDQSQKAATNGLRSLHEASVLDFANPANFGFIKDRQHIAGFREHQFTEIPAPQERLALVRLDLVGLVLHKEPVAYISENLPRMDELRTAPTRSLDDFENAGLSALRGGEDLFVSEHGTECRMIGAIRALRQCLACHDRERGELLGAFSYTLTSARKELPR